MKRFLFIAALAGAALVSCTKNEVVEVAEQDAITFATPVTTNITKAVEIVGNYPSNLNFSVFGHYFTGNYTSIAEGQLYMNNVKTAYSPAVVGWDPAAVEGGVNYYWPKQGTITFAAYSPSDCTPVAYNEEGIQFPNFTVAPQAENQFDLLFSERAYNQTKADMTTVEDPYKGVQIKFNHALSSIFFTVKSDKDYTADKFRIEVTKIELQNVAANGSFTQGLDDKNLSSTAANTDHPGWTVNAKSKTDYVAFSGAQELTTTASATNNIEVRDNNKNNTNLILLPQPLEGTEDEAGVTLYVEYTIYNDNTEAVVYQTATLPITNYGIVYQWYRGNRYTYNITIGLDKIYFDPTVTEWYDVPSGSVTIGK